jgi:hypothetical protein
VCLGARLCVHGMFDIVVVHEREALVLHRVVPKTR